MHYANLSLPTSIANGMTRDPDDGVEIIPLVGGGSVRNEIWDAPLRRYELPFPTMKEDSTVFLAIRDLWKVVRSVHTFTYFDPLDGENVRVRFDGTLKESHVAGPWWQFETILLVEEPA